MAQVLEFKKPKTKVTPKTLPPGERCGVDRGIFAYREMSGTLKYGITYTATDKRGRKHRVREISGTTVTAARKALAVRKAEVLQGRYQYAGDAKCIRLHELCEDYIRLWAKPKKPKSWKRDRGVMVAFQNVFGKDTPIDRIDTHLIDEYEHERLKTVTRATVNRELAILKKMLRRAVAWKMIAEVPAMTITKEDERETKALDEDQQRRLLDACAGTHLRPIVLTAIHTGLRRGELLRLMWADVDLEGRELTVLKAKSGKVDKVKLHTQVVRTLEALEHRTGPVFLFRGGPITTNLNRSWRTACQKAGIEEITYREIEDEDTGAVTRRRQIWPRFHDLRHTSATNLRNAGADLPEIQKHLRQSSITLAARYTHVGSRESTVDQVPDIG